MKCRRRVRILSSACCDGNCLVDRSRSRSGRAESPLEAVGFASGAAASCCQPPLLQRGRGDGRAREGKKRKPPSQHMPVHPSHCWEGPGGPAMSPRNTWELLLPLEGPAPTQC